MATEGGKTAQAVAQVRVGDGVGCIGEALPGLFGDAQWLLGGDRRGDTGDGRDPDLDGHESRQARQGPEGLQQTRRQVVGAHAPRGRVGMEYKDAVPQIGHSHMRGEGRRQMLGDLLVHERQIARPLDEMLQAASQVQSIGTKRFAQEGAPQQ